MKEKRRNQRVATKVDMISAVFWKAIQIRKLAFGEES